MPQPVKHSREDMLDAARALILTSGPAAASIKGVAVAVGAPSGSIYHQFPGRDDLMAAVWLRAQDRFLEFYLSELASPKSDAGIAAAVSILTWVGRNPEDAELLLRHGLRDILRGEVSIELDRRAESNQQQVHAVIARFAEEAQLPLADALVAVVDLPYATARRIMREKRLPTNEDVRALERAASLLLGPQVG